MKTLNSFTVVLYWWVAVFGVSPLRGDAAPEQDSPKSQSFSLLSAPNQLPQVEIVFPPPGVRFRFGGLIQIRARAFDPDGSISQVQFFAGTNLIGIVTNAPYDLTWTFISDGAVFTAVAVDDLGATNASAPVFAAAYQSGGGNFFHIDSPTNDTICVEPATFNYTATLVYSDGRGDPALFYINSNLVATVVDPPYSMTVTNLPAGEYVLEVGPTVPPPPASNPYRVNITVLKLALESPQLAPDRGFEFLLDGTLAGKSNVVEISSNFLTWLPIATNVPSTNSFLFLDPTATNSPLGFYRIKLLP